MNNILHKCILSKNVPNMIIYGRPFMYQSFIDVYYEINNIDKTHHIRDKNYEHFHYKCSSKHYEIDCEKFNKDNRNDFNRLFTSLIETKEYYVNLSHKTIIFYNCDQLKHSLQNTFRVIIEKYRKTCVFIFLCYKINRFIEPLKSRCILLRMSQLSMYQKCQVSAKLDRTNDELKNKIYDHLEMFPSSDDIDAIDLCKDKLAAFENHYQLLADKIIKIIEIKNMTIHYYNLIREYSYDILKYNLDIPLFFKNLLNIFINDKKYTSEILSNVIRLLSEIEHKILTSYKKLILIEGVFFSLHEIIHPNHSNILNNTY
jgi:hypothetical protein